MTTRQKVLLLFSVGLALVLAVAFVGKGRAQAPQVTLLWTVPQGAQNYEMHYSRNAVGADTLAWWNGANVVPLMPAPGSVGGTDSVTVLLGSWAQRYYFVVRACNQAGCAGWSNVATFTTPAAPPNRILDLRAR